MLGDGSYMNHNKNLHHKKDKTLNNTIFFIVAAFNEALVIEDVVKCLINEGYKVIVVDDCSTDNTLVKAVESGATVIRHPINLGQGAALQTGIDYCLGQQFSVLVTFDADGQHQIKDAKRLIECILNDEADVAFGSRFLGIKAISMPPIRAAILRLIALYMRLFLGLPVTDAHNGLRAISPKAALAIQLTQNRMAHASELISQVKNFRLKELPVEIIYTPYSLSKGQRISNSFNILLDLIIGKINK
jgi:glycosyltransferase involved in cell wall biosynthesis